MNDVRISDAEFREVASPIVGNGGSWADVARVTGMKIRTVHKRAQKLGMSSGVRGRPVGTPQSAEARAKIAAGNRAFRAMQR